MSRIPAFMWADHVKSNQSRNRPALVCTCGDDEMTPEADTEAQARAILAADDPLSALAIALHHRHIEIARLKNSLKSQGISDD